MKKKIISIISAMALAVSAMPLNTAAEETKNDEILVKLENGELPTDANMDGKTDASDIHAIMMYYTISLLNPDRTYTESKKISEEVFNNVRDNFDYNSDGQVDTSEASLLLTYYYSGFEAGDVDCDGTLTSADASLVLYYYAETMVGNAVEFEIDTNMRNLGDINGDNSIDAADASMILYEYSKTMTS